MLLRKLMMLALLMDPLMLRFTLVYMALLLTLP